MAEANEIPTFNGEIFVRETDFIRLKISAIKIQDQHIGSRQII